MGTKLYFQVYFLRFFQQINSLLDIHWATPRVRGHAFTTSIPSRLSKHPGNIKLYFYMPVGCSPPTRGTPSKSEHPLIVNFYGGGFTIGHAKDDGRWASTLLDNVNAIYVSVNYRRGPVYPQPTAIEDCVDALRWLWAHADDYGIDRTRTVLTGFSAGGNCTFATLLRHYAERQEEGPDASLTDGRATGIVAFYPAVNMTISRNVKYELNPIAKEKGTLPPWMVHMFDAAYHQNSPLESRNTINLSPALAPKEMLGNALPEKIAIYSCEIDMLLGEAEDFRKELQALGKTVSGQIVPNVPHAFDKPIFGHHKKERDEMYRSAVDDVKSMI